MQSVVERFQGDSKLFGGTRLIASVAATVPISRQEAKGRGAEANERLENFNEAERPAYKRLRTDNKSTATVPEAKFVAGKRPRGRPPKGKRWSDDEVRARVFLAMRDSPAASNDARRRFASRQPCGHAPRICAAVCHGGKCPEGGAEVRGREVGWGEEWTLAETNRN